MTDAFMEQLRRSARIYRQCSVGVEFFVWPWWVMNAGHHVTQEGATKAVLNIGPLMLYVRYDFRSPP